MDILQTVGNWYGFLMMLISVMGVFYNVITNYKDPKNKPDLFPVILVCIGLLIFSNILINEYLQ